LQELTAMPKQKSKAKVLKAADAAKLKQALLDLLKEQRQLDAKIKKLDNIVTVCSIRHS
jgi:uncharacterized protein YlxW (UPF0749 family)